MYTVENWPGTGRCLGHDGIDAGVLDLEIWMVTMLLFPLLESISLLNHNGFTVISLSSYWTLQVGGIAPRKLHVVCIAVRHWSPRNFWLDLSPVFTELSGFENFSLFEVSLSWANCNSSRSHFISRSCVSMWSRSLSWSSWLDWSGEVAVAEGGKLSDGRTLSGCSRILAWESFYLLGWSVISRRLMLRLLSAS